MMTIVKRRRLMKKAPLLALAFVLLASLFPAWGEAAEFTPPAAAVGQIERTVYDLNTVNHEELVSIRGIGPALAGRILEERARRGFFTGIEDLLEIRGIGEKSYARLKERFILSPPPSTAAKTTPAAR
jgi:competence ComEA-like helix-hairpin-helix protein